MAKTTCRSKMEPVSLTDEATIQAAFFHLSYARSLASVGTGLYLTYQNDEEWDGFQHDPLFRHTMIEMAKIATEMQDTDVTALDEEKEEKLDRLNLKLVKSVTDLAALIDVEPTDLLNILLRT